MHAFIRSGSFSALVLALALSGCSESGDPVPPTPVDPSRPELPLRRPGQEVTAPAQVAPPISIDPTDPQNWTKSGPNDDPTKIEIGGLHTRKPPTWIWHTPSMGLRDLQYAVPGRDGAESADLILGLYFDRDGGPNELNVDRWNRQFLDEEGRPTTPVSREQFELDVPVLVVEHRGRYLQMGAAAPRDGMMQLAAIVEAPMRRIFVRLVGPEATVEANRDAFVSMVTTFRPINFDLPPAGAVPEG